jgi:cellulose biosynthesis protein BcsQ
LPTTSSILPLTDVGPLHGLREQLRGQKRRKVLVIANGKGGVGKSSLAATLAETLTRVPYRVLLMEMDPQGNNAEDLGFIGTDLYDQGRGQAAAILEGRGGLKPTGEARHGLWVVPGGEALEEVIEELYCQRRAARKSGDDTWMYMYAAAIAEVAEDYDLIILDVAPGSLVLQLQAMVAGDMVMVPCRSDASSRKGLRTVARRFRDATAHNPRLRLIGVVVFGVGSRARIIQDEIRDLLTGDLQGNAPVFETTIRYVEKVAVKCRERGVVPRELARQVAAQLADPAVTSSAKKGLASLASSAKGLASDYRSLGLEVMAEVAQRRREDGS